MIPKRKIDSPWVPTGLSCVQEDNAVLVANYFGHNVLEFRLVDERLELQCSYECAGMKSPEGVAVSRDGRLVGVADYDGNRLWVFVSRRTAFVAERDRSGPRGRVRS